MFILSGIKSKANLQWVPRRAKTDYAITTGPYKLQVFNVPSNAAITKDFVNNMLRTQGYVFLRGAEVTDCKKFKALHAQIFENLYDYFGQGGIYTGTRKDEVPGVYEFVNVSTPFWDMPAHNDLAYRPAMAGRMALAHFKPASKGGSTPLYDMRLVWIDLVSQFYPLMVDLHRHGVIYTKNLPDANNTTKASLWLKTADIPTWQSNYPNMTKEQITATLEAQGEKVEWLPDGTLRQSWHLPAFRQHPETGEYFFCNQILGFDARNFWQWPGRPFGDLAFIDCPTHVRVGNGKDLTDAEYEGVLDAHHKNAMRGQWQTGDLVIMDNIRMTHSRDPYEGERRLAISWGNTVPAEPFKGTHIL
eukprot:TRINITY_DN9519_c0_g1_i1.p1 TRINITY_DN9519_c0_g1~~TRINITY_DN9519_c0_g1_i1.p1  ORF type:complete len:360 (+),score=54.10 TRINITY_DN9519_c0_g1_i1:33-1112(+)